MKNTIFRCLHYEFQIYSQNSVSWASKPQHSNSKTLLKYIEESLNIQEAFKDNLTTIEQIEIFWRLSSLLSCVKKPKDLIYQCSADIKTVEKKLNILCAIYPNNHID